MLKIRKVFWSDVRDAVAQKNLRFFNQVDPLSPGMQCPMYLVEYGYGDLVSDDEGIFLPAARGQSFRLNAAQIPRTLLKDLGYGLKNSPLGLFYNKSFEWFLNTSNEQANKSFALSVANPGSFFNFRSLISSDYKLNHRPDGIFFVMAGSKSNCMLPKISCSLQHARIQKNYKITQSAPHSYYEHAELFQGIVRSRGYDSDWQASVLYFSEPWAKNIKQDSAWQGVKNYFYELLCAQLGCALNSEYYNHIYRVVNKRNNLKSNVLIYETARYLFEILLGFKLGFAPAVDNELLPLHFIQEVYSECYQLEYLPLVVVPAYYNPLNSGPVYYSLQYPALCSYSPKARSASTLFSDLTALVHVVQKYQRDFSLPIRECKNTLLAQVAQGAQFHFYHPAASEEGFIHSPACIPLRDDRFMGSLKFPVNAAFFKGCIAISKS